MENVRKSLYFKSSKLISQKRTIDLILLIWVIIISLLGLLMVYDASQFEAFQSFNDRNFYIKQQAISFFIGLLFLSFFSFFDYKKLKKIAYPFFIFSLLILLLVFIPGLGVAAYGAHRWLRILGFTIQPAEVIKLAGVIFFANLFREKSRFLPLIIILFFISSVIGILQKDLGSAIVFTMVALGIYYIAGAPILHFLGLATIGILGAIAAIVSAPYRIKRILAFFDPFSDPQGFSYHILQILIALGSGGFMGVGIGQSRQKFAYIPEVTTDSIFSIVGEEFGFLGGAAVICLFGFLVIRGFQIAQKAPDNFGKFLASGLTIWLGAQAAVNLAAMTALLPLTGVPLPFFSYGGSALVANLIAIGILLNISKQEVKI